MNELKFKPGDKVIFGTEEGEKWHDVYPTAYPPVGTIGTVVGFKPKVRYDECNVFVQWPEGSTAVDGRWYCDEDFLELVSEHVFKVGDKVRFNERGAHSHKNNSWCYPEVGTIGEIIDVSATGSIRVQWPAEAFYQGFLEHNDGNWYCPAQCLDLVEDEKTLDIHGGFTMIEKPTLEDMQKVTDETPDELWPRTNPLLDISEAKDVILPLSEYSTRVDVLRKNRVQVAFYKYGPARKNFGGGRVDAFKTAELCMDAFRKDHNTEHLLDAMNYLMFRFMYPYPGEEFKPTDSDGSVGTVGTPINME